MKELAPVPGSWPEHRDTLEWMERLARRYLGDDYSYLAPEVVSRVSEDWRYRESSANDRARIETRLRSTAHDLRRSEQRRSARERHYAAAAPASSAEDFWLVDLFETIDASELGQRARAVVELLVQGYSVEEISRQTGLSRYRVKKHLMEVARAAGLRPARD